MIKNREGEEDAASRASSTAMERTEEKDNAGNLKRGQRGRHSARQTLRHVGG